MLIKTPNGEDKYMPTAAAEMAQEGNYNMIDGVMNNKPPTAQELQRKEAVEKSKERSKDHERKISEHANRTVVRGTRRRRSAER